MRKGKYGVGHGCIVGEQIGRRHFEQLRQKSEIVESNGGDLVLVAIDPRRALVLTQSHAIAQCALAQPTQLPCL